MGVKILIHQHPYGTHMCVTNNLQKHIRNLTNDGEIVARFLVDTVQGNTPGAKPCHQLEAMKHIVRFGFTRRHKSSFPRRRESRGAGRGAIPLLGPNPHTRRTRS